MQGAEGVSGENSQAGRAMRLCIGPVIAIVLAGLTNVSCARSPAREVTAGCLDSPRGSEGMIQACTTAIGVAGTPADALALLYNARGEAHCMRREYDLAIPDQDQAIRLKPGFAQAYVDRAWCYVGKGDKTAAVASCEGAIRSAPRAVDYYRECARVDNWIGDHDHALVTYDAGIKIGPHVNLLIDERQNPLRSRSVR